VSKKRQLPEFNPWRKLGIATGPPPFAFDQSTFRYFPLRANFHQLEAFCDQYLNIAEDFAYFRPAMPFVILWIAYYGKMEPTVRSLGWASQSEIFFSIPIEWYQPVNGSYEFRGLASVSPFIYLDNEYAQVDGREVYGWPKVQGWIDPTINSWTRNPRFQREVLRFKTRVFDRLYTGDNAIPRDLLVIEEEAPPNPSVMPFQLDNSLNPFTMLPKAALGWGSIFQSALESMTAIGTDNMYSDSGLPPVMGPQLLTAMTDFLQGFHSNSINLKQLRDAQEPNKVCYRSITNAIMTITAFKHGGMLGDYPLLSGDPTGGFSIRLHRHASEPIIETLGLEIEGEQRIDGDTVATLKPVMPFWHNLNWEFGDAETLCYQDRTGTWRSHQQRGKSKGDPTYNRTGSANFQIASGPFRFPDANIRVLPLLAKKAKLQAICDDYLMTVGAPGITRLEPFGSYVYLLINTFGDMSSEEDNFGQWADTTVDFCIPVRVYKPLGEDEEVEGLTEEERKNHDRLVTIALVSPFMYSGSDIGTSTYREVNGWPVNHAQINSPPNSWLGLGGPGAAFSRLLELRTMGWIGAAANQKSEWARLIDVYQLNRADDAYDLGERWTEQAITWGKVMQREIEQFEEAALDSESGAETDEFRALRALALEILFNKQPINQLSFKQFRDAGRPECACYQALVQSSIVIERLQTIREMKRPLRVRIARMDTQDIVRTLGLQLLEEDSNGNAYWVQSSRAFYLRADLKTLPSRNLCWRAGSMKWRVPGEDSDSKRYFQQQATAVSAGMVEQAMEKPRKLRERTDPKTVSPGTGPAIDMSTARRAVLSDSLGPQAVVHATLSEFDRSGDTLPKFLFRLSGIGRRAATSVFGDEIEVDKAEDTFEDRFIWPQPRSTAGDPEGGSS
jgi:hypothetical protein